MSVFQHLGMIRRCAIATTKKLERSNQSPELQVSPCGPSSRSSQASHRSSGASSGAGASASDAFRRPRCTWPATCCQTLALFLPSKVLSHHLQWTGCSKYALRHPVSITQDVLHRLCSMIRYISNTFK